MRALPSNVPDYSDKPRRRFEQHYETGEPLRLSPYNRNVLAKRTLFLARVVPSDKPDRLLKSGVHQRKIGSHVAKGAWRGLPIFTLTLEERATCPETCRNWLTCYGNAMNWSERITADAGLMPRLSAELGALAREFRRGFVVRLHILGDFFSAEYVEFWAEQLARHPGLNIFGYTAWQPGADREVGLLCQLRTLLDDGAAHWVSGALTVADLTLVTDNDAPQDTSAEYCAAVAAVRLQRLIAAALADYCLKPTERRDMLPSAWIASELVRQVPGILEAVQAGGGR